MGTTTPAADTPRLRLLRAAADVLAALGAVGGTITVKCKNADGSLVIVGGDAEEARRRPDPEAARAAPDGGGDWLWLSPTEAAVVRVATDQWQCSEDLARLADVPSSGEFRAILRNMVERGILDSLQAKGFRLKAAPAEGAKP